MRVPVLSPSPAEDVPLCATAASFHLQPQTRQTLYQDLAVLKELQMLRILFRPQGSGTQSVCANSMYPHP